MLPLESNADDSFHNLFDSLRGQARQRQELEQAELLLRVIEDARGTRESQPARRGRKEYMNVGVPRDDEDDDGDLDDSRSAAAGPDPDRPAADSGMAEGFQGALRQMMGSGELTRNGRNFLSRAGSAAEARRQARKRKTKPEREWGGRVHTLDDLPRDPDWFVLDGGGPRDEDDGGIAEIKVSPARRLSDGRRFYSAEFLGGSIADALRLGPFTISIEWMLIAVIGLFLAGVWLGRVASRRKARREMAALRREHASHLLTIRNRLLEADRTGTLQAVPEQQQQPASGPSAITPATNSSSATSLFSFAG